MLRSTVSRRAAALGLAAALLAGASWPARADFPDRAIKLVVPFAPGGPTDALARHLAEGLKARLGQSVIIDNRGGAGGNIGAEAVANAPADGYTLLFGTSGPLAINVSLYGKLGYDPVASFAPVIMIGTLPNVLTVNPSVPAKTVQELIAYAKSGKQTLSFASSGNGASSHLAGIMFNTVAGTDFVHVPYRGTGPALNDLIGGQVQMTFTDVLTAQPHVRAGTLRALGVTSATRSGALPEVPTLAEQGMPGFDVSVFFGIVAPKATPPEVVARLNRAFAETLADPAIQQVLTAQGIIAAPATDPGTLAAFMAAEIPKWREVIKKANVEVN
jgi:tripartite-type tricarboxylate transporter receptor subunit TctC